MILTPFRRNRRDDSIDRLYGAIVAQARRPVFYTDFGVPDTAEGRLEMIMLHTVLLLQRTTQDDALRPLGQAVFDRFCRDMDDNLREMGVGDLSVPKKMRRIAGAFYGRAKAYEAALAAPDPAKLADALRRNIYGNEAESEHRQAFALATYVRVAREHLWKQDPGPLIAGQLSFPAPPASENRPCGT